MTYDCLSSNSYVVGYIFCLIYSSKFYVRILICLYLLYLIYSFKHSVRWFNQTPKFYRYAYIFKLPSLTWCFLFQIYAIYVTLRFKIPMWRYSCQYYRFLNSLSSFQPMLQELGKQNPQLLRLIQDHHAEFLQLINEPSEGYALQHPFLEWSCQLMDYLFSFLIFNVRCYCNNYSSLFAHFDHLCLCYVFCNLKRLWALWTTDKIINWSQTTDKIVNWLQWWFVWRAWSRNATRY